MAGKKEAAFWQKAAGRLLAAKTFFNTGNGCQTSQRPWRRIKKSFLLLLQKKKCLPAADSAQTIMLQPISTRASAR
jgi:hypothetical protein